LLPPQCNRQQAKGIKTIYKTTPVNQGLCVNFNVMLKKYEHFTNLDVSNNRHRPIYFVPYKNIKIVHKKLDTIIELLNKKDNK
jgi:hypothetical protein